MKRAFQKENHQANKNGDYRHLAKYGHVLFAISLLYYALNCSDVGFVLHGSTSVNVLPCAASYDSYDVGVGDVVVSSYCGKGDSTHSVLLTDVPNVPLCKLGHWVDLTSLLESLSWNVKPSLYDCILGVVPWSSKEEVAWVYASWIVATVTDKHTFWDLAVVELPGDSIGSPSLSIHPEGSIALCDESLSPSPAAVFLCDIGGIEALLDGQHLIRLNLLQMLGMRPARAGFAASAKNFLFRASATLYWITSRVSRLATPPEAAGLASICARRIAGASRQESKGGDTERSHRVEYSTRF